MLTATSNAQAFQSRLTIVPAVVQAAIAQAAVATAARAYAPTSAKAEAIAALSGRAQGRRLHPDRRAVLARFAKPDTGPAPDPVALKLAAVQSALAALGDT